eukprot:s1_g1485.t1
MEHVVGPQAQVISISIGPDDDMEQRRNDILEAVDAVDQGDGVILLTDMFGGTPSNLAISIMDKAKVEVIAGINLPMLIKLASVRDSVSLADAVEQAQDSGRKYISVASKVIKKTLTISNARGLHARASAKFVQCVEGFDADVRVSREGQTVGGTSIMGLMMLAAATGCTIDVEVEGPEAAAALAALEALLADKFGEGE